MGQVVRLPGGITTLQDAADAFLDHHDLARSTRRIYRASLASLVAGLGSATAVGELSGPMLADWFRGRYAAAAPATWNRELATLRAAVGWWRRRGWLTVDPTDGLERRRERVDRTIGGASDVSGSVVPLQSSEVFDPNTNTWQPVDALLPVGRGSLSAERGPGNVILAFGGFESGVTASTRVEALPISQL